MFIGSLFTGCYSYKPLLSVEELADATIRHNISYAATLTYSGYISEALDKYSQIYSDYLEVGKVSRAREIARIAYALALSISDSVICAYWVERTGSYTPTGINKLRNLYVFGEDPAIITITLNAKYPVFSVGDSLETLLLRSLALLRLAEDFSSEYTLIRFAVNKSSENVGSEQDSFTLSFAYHTLSLMEYHRMEYSKSLVSVQKAVRIDSALTNYSGLAEDYLLKARILLALKNYKDAVASVLESERVFVRMNNNEGIENVKAVLLGIKKAQNDKQSALLFEELKANYRFTSTRRILSTLERFN